MMHERINDVLMMHEKVIITHDKFKKTELSMITHGIFLLTFNILKSTRKFLIFNVRPISGKRKEAPLTKKIKNKNTKYRIISVSIDRSRRNV